MYLIEIYYITFQDRPVVHVRGKGAYAPSLFLDCCLTVRTLPFMPPQ